MFKIASVAAVLGVTLLAGSAEPVSAATAPRPLAQAVRATPPPADEGPAILRSRTVAINDAALAGVCTPAGLTGPLRLGLFGDVAVVATTVSSHRDGDTVTWRGGVAGSPSTWVLLTVVGACDTAKGNLILAGTVLLNGRQFDLSPAGPGKVTILELDPLAPFHEVDVGKLTPPPPEHRPAPSGGHRKKRDDCAQPADVPVIDLMMLYTPEAKAAAGGETAMQAKIAKNVANTNTALADSGVKGRVRLVHAQEIAGYTGGQDDMETALGAVSREKNGLEGKVLPLRDQYGADEVGFVINGGSGLAWIPQPPKATTSSQGYFIVGQAYLAGTSLIHEMGHNFGSNHDWFNRPNYDGPELYKPAHGYTSPARRWHTIMSYGEECAPAGCPRLLRFSNAAQSYQGEALGIAAGDKAADNVPLMNAYGLPGVASYRESKSPVSLCTLTAQAKPADAGTVSAASAGPYEPGTVVAVTAIPKPGYVFSGWRLAGADAGTTRPLQVTMDQDKTLEAVFVAGPTPTHRLDTSTTPAGGGTITLTPPGNDPPEGTLVTATVEPATGFAFQGWTLDGADAGTSRAIDVTADKAHTLIAKFVALDVTPKVVIKPDAAAGTTTLKPACPCYEGQTVEFTAAANPGWRFVEWVLPGYAARPGVASRKPAVSKGFVGTAVFERDVVPLALTTDVTPSGSGTVEVSSPGPYAPGTKVTATAKPAAGKRFIGWQLDGKDAGTATALVVAMDTDHHLVAQFENIAVVTHTLTTSVTPAGSGTVTLSADGPHPPGTKVTATATPAAGKRFVQWSLGGAPVGTAGVPTVEITMNADHVLSAVFEDVPPVTRTLTTNVTPDGAGTVEASAPGPYPDGAKVTLTAKPAAGRGFTGWKVDGVSAGTATVLEVAMDADRTVEARFEDERPGPVSALTTSVAPAGSGAVQLSSGGPYPPGTKVTATARPGAGKVFTEWMLDGAPAGADPVLEVVMDTDHVLVARFTDQKFVLTATVTPQRGGTVRLSAEGPQVAGTEVTATATPASGYRFAGWMLDGLQQAGVRPTHTVTMDSDHEVVARFELIYYTLTTSVTPQGKGTVRVSATGPRPSGSWVVAIAKPASGYRFTGWVLDGVAAGSMSTYTVTMDGDHTLVAMFETEHADPIPPPVTTEADLVVWVKGTPPTRVAGQGGVSYTFKVTNKGPRTAPATQLSLNLDRRLTKVVLDRRCRWGAKQIVVCPVGRVRVGGSATIKIQGSVEPAATGTLVVSGAAGFAGIERNPRDNVATARTSVRALARLAVTVKASKLVRGKTALYTFTITNKGPSTAAGVSLGDRLSRNLSAARASGGRCRAKTKWIGCQLGALHPGQKIVERHWVKVSIRATATLTNCATGYTRTPQTSKTGNQICVKGKVTGKKR